MNTTTIIETRTLQRLIIMAHGYYRHVQDGSIHPDDIKDNDVEGLEEKSLQEAEAAIDSCEGFAPMLDASTGHLSQADHQILLALSETQGRATGFFRVTNHEYGWCVFLASSPDGDDLELKNLRELGASECLLGLIDYAQQKHAFILNFDRDASLLSGFPVQENL